MTGNVEQIIFEGNEQNISNGTFTANSIVFLVIIKIFMEPSPQIR
ncbi:hypothetical protein BGP_6472 [Beggiatoa sp. PS]|nr:hypothetical protein BGP_6472 [Beggiatoa sp. PS]